MKEGVLQKKNCLYIPRWNSLKQALEKGELSLPDVIFAERMLGNAGTENSAFFIASLFASAREGHLCLPIEEERMWKGAGEVPEAFKQEFLHVEATRWYFKKNWEIEKRFIQEWKRLLENPPQLEMPLELVQKESAYLKLQEEQEKAILNAATSSLSFICGGPGTGKTFTAAALISLFKEKFPCRVVAAAPTGKAAANLREKLPLSCEAYTLHSALRKKAFLSADLILIDEGSMVDASTMASLFSQIPSGARLILLGDPNQLPPVETGNLFADLIAHPTSTVVQLKKCLRAELRAIIELAEAVLLGENISCQPLPEANALLQLVLNRFIHSPQMEAEEWLSYYSTFRVLSPLRQGPYGTDVLNRRLFEKHIAAVSKPFIPIMVTDNDYNLGLFNGDIGILNYNSEEVFFKGGRKLPLCRLSSYSWGYFLSVHKSQGSEYEEVILLIPEGAEKFGKEVIYTAVTRAKKRVTVYGEPKILSAMLKKTSLRYSGIRY